MRDSTCERWKEAREPSEGVRALLAELQDLRPDSAVPDDDLLVLHRLQCFYAPWDHLGPRRFQPIPSRTLVNHPVLQSRLSKCPRDVHALLHNLAETARMHADHHAHKTVYAFLNAVMKPICRRLEDKPEKKRRT